LSNQKQIVLAILMYAGDNQGTLPGPAVPFVLDPLVTNPQPGAPVVGGVAMSQLSVWNSNSTYYETRELSNQYLLQKYLGGIGSRNVWFCTASDSIRNAPIYSGAFAGKQPGWGYMINSTDVNPMATPTYLFGAYSAIGTGSPAVTEVDQTPKKLSNIMGAVSGNPDADGRIVYVRDHTKVWIITDVDGRNCNATVSGSFNLSPGAGSVSGTATTNKNGFKYQPPHKVNNQMPGGLGRNYGYLDGHCEFKLFNDWPGSAYGTN
jgi:prepilin-type processing-associated H-X9-DG protein